MQDQSTDGTIDRTLQVTLDYQGNKVQLTLNQKDCPKTMGRHYLEKKLNLKNNTLTAISGEHFTIEFKDDDTYKGFRVCDHSKHGTFVEHPEGKTQQSLYHQGSFLVGQRSHVRLRGQVHSDDELDHDVLFEMVDPQFEFDTGTEPLPDSVKTDWELLLLYLRVTQAAHLTGMPGIGKSWLANRLATTSRWQHQVRQELGDILVVSVDGAMVKADKGKFWRNLAIQILLGLRQALSGCGQTHIVPEIDGYLKHLRGEWIEKIPEVTGPLTNALSAVQRKANLRPILIFDNFDQLYANLQPKMLYTLYHLHHQSHELKGKISFVLITRESFPQLRTDLYEDEVGKFNRLFQNRDIALSYLQQDQFSTLLSDLVPRQCFRGTEAANVLYHFSGGHPALAKELCKRLELEGILHCPELWHDWLQKMEWTTEIPASCEEIWSYLNAQQRKAVVDYAKGKLSFHQMPSRYKMIAILPKDKFFSPIFRACVLHWGKKIKVPGLRIDPQKERVFVHGKDITKKIRNRKEFHLLFCMYERRGNLCTYEELLRHCWPNDKHLDADRDRQRILRAVNRLCSDVDPDRDNPKYIINSPGQGYTLQI